MGTKKLTWVAGNDVNLSVWLYENLIVDDEVTRSAFDFTTCDSLSVYLTKSNGSNLKVTYAVSDEEVNRLVVRIPYTVPVGSYSLGIEAVQSDCHLRSFESGIIRLVRDNADGTTLFERIESNRTTEYEIEMQVTPQADVRPLNPYEVWKEDNPDGTFDEFMAYYANIIISDAYQKPDGGIPKSDLESSVQSSLDKADSALQEHQDISGKADKSDTEGVFYY